MDAEYIRLNRQHYLHDQPAFNSADDEARANGGHLPKDHPLRLAAQASQDAMIEAWHRLKAHQS